MLSALPSIDRRELFSRLAGGTGTTPTVVTSSRRLAQALARAFDRERAAAGESAWSTPDFIPFGSWVERFWSDALYSEAAPGLPLLLTEVQELAMWQDSIAATHADGLLSLHAAAQEAARAWRLAHAWGLAADINASANPQGSTPRQDRRVVRAFERTGFTWGGVWPTAPDGMHFEWHGGARG